MIQELFNLMAFVLFAFLCGALAGWAVHGR